MNTVSISYVGCVMNTEQKMNLLILGAGGHGRVVREVAEATGQYENIAFFDDNTDQTDVIGKLSDYDKFTGQFDYAFVAIGRKDYNGLLQSRRTRKTFSSSVVGLIMPCASKEV